MSPKSISPKPESNSLSATTTPTSKKAPETNVKSGKKRQSIKTKKLCFEDSSDDTSSDAASVNDAEATGTSTKKSVNRFCYKCSDDDDITDNELISCQGVCRRIFHRNCANFSEPQESFYCNECRDSK